MLRCRIAGLPVLRVWSLRTPCPRRAPLFPAHPARVYVPLHRMERCRLTLASLSQAARRPLPLPCSQLVRPLIHFSIAHLSSERLTTLLKGTTAQVPSRKSSFP